MKNPLQLHEAGQAVWLDFVDRKFLAEGGLRKLIAEDGLTGVTSNPSIFEKAMGQGEAYDAVLVTETERMGLDLQAVTAELVEDGVRQFADAADKLLAAVEKKRLAFADRKRT